MDTNKRYVGGDYQAGRIMGRKLTATPEHRAARGAREFASYCQDDPQHRATRAFWLGVARGFREHGA